MLHPMQIIFIASVLCVLAYLALVVVGWGVRRYTTMADHIMLSEGEQPAISLPVADRPVAHSNSNSRNRRNEHQDAATRPQPVVAPQRELCRVSNGQLDITSDQPNITSDQLDITKAEAVVALLAIGLKKNDGSNLTETEAIKAVFGCSPGSGSAAYQQARAAIDAAKAAATPVQITPIARRVTRAKFKPR